MVGRTTIGDKAYRELARARSRQATELAAPWRGHDVGRAAHPVTVRRAPSRGEAEFSRYSQLVGTSVPDEPNVDPVRILTTESNAARVYNYYLGGTAHFAIDREVAEQAAAVYPGGMQALRDGVRANRDFIGRSVRFLANEAGIRQFLDLGTGIPDDDNVHAVAQSTAPDSRIVCVDYDPVVLAHAHVLMTSTPEGAATFVQGDFRDHDHVLRAAEGTLDLYQPVAVMLVALLHFFDDDEAYRLVARYLDAVPSGSYLVVSHVANDLTSINEMARLAEERIRESVFLRSRPEVTRFFDGLDLVEPGLVPIDEWRSDGEARSGVFHYGGVARKP